MKSFFKTIQRFLNKLKTHRRFKVILLLVFGFSAFIFFLILKLPEARIQNLLLAHLRILSQDQGLIFSAEKVKLGVLFGPTLKIYNAEFKSIENEALTLKIGYLKVSPHILSMIFQTKKASFYAELLDGDISGTIAISPSHTKAEIKISSLQIGKTTLVKHFLPIDFSAAMQGKLDLNIESDQIHKSEGSVHFELKKINLPTQSFYGFNLPKIQIEKTLIDLSISQGKVFIRTFDIGSDIKNDDFLAQVTGDMTLQKNILSSQLNAKAVFEISSRITQSFPLLDTLLGPAKIQNGKYAYRLAGPLIALEPQPGG